MSVSDIVGREGVSVFDFDLGSDIEDVVVESFIQSKQELVQELQEDVRVSQVQLESILVVGNWTNRTAVEGETPLQIIATFTIFGHKFDPELTQIYVDEMEEKIAEGDVEKSERLNEVVPEILIEDASENPIESEVDDDDTAGPFPGDVTGREDIINFNLGDRTGNMVIDVAEGATGEVYILGEPEEITGPGIDPTEEGPEKREVNTLSYEEALERFREARDAGAAFGEFEIEAEDLPMAEIAATPEGLPEEVLLQRQFPGVPVELIEFLQDDGTLEIEAGKETKNVEPREMFDFEKRMAYRRTRLAQEEGFSMEDQIQTGAGAAADDGTFGEDHMVPNFPPTVEYIRNRLLYEGPAYQLEVFNDMVVYTGFLRDLYRKKFKASSYQTIRTIFSRLEMVHEKELAPQLIRKLTGAELKAAGLSVTPKMKLRGGEEIEAPWLESRKYYTIVKDNADHPAWDNLHDLLFGEE